MEPYDSRTNGQSTNGSSSFQSAGVEREPSRPIKELVSELLDQGRRLVRAEVQLARAEVKTEVKKASVGVGLTAGGGLVVLLGAFTFVAFLVIALAGVMPLWLSALLVAVVLLAGGAGIAYLGLQRMKTVHGPTKTLQTLKEDGQWANRTMHSMKSQMHGHA
ncbi:phage holin family protein [Hyalangium rubrum]|uniref:Phage holin family protein n=1 Tax=Hyalangium rubrum TaxID=3103134 RepID=A0ABU5H843_9BACT|nr:phage holin family protein [Hyalangium sp. s54d21]MDY7229049.1 phage holin family protein [Hyalangium sp. s54d21]